MASLIYESSRDQNSSLLAFEASALTIPSHLPSPGSRVFDSLFGEIDCLPPSGLWYGLSSRALPHSSHLCILGTRCMKTVFYYQLDSQSLMMRDSSVVLETAQDSPLGEHLGQFCVDLLCGPQCRAEMFAEF